MKTVIEECLNQVELQKSLPLHARFWNVSMNHKKKGEDKYVISAFHLTSKFYTDSFHKPISQCIRITLLKSLPTN